MTSKQIGPLAIIVPFILWRLYMRFRRNIGRQPYHPQRMVTAIIVFSLSCVLLGFATLTYLPSLAALGGGILLSVPLALFGLHLTKFEITPKGNFYTPNTHIGLALILIFAGRIVYRMVVLFIAPPSDMVPPQLFQSPLTLFLYGLTAGYYIAYNAAVLIKGKKNT